MLVRAASSLAGHATSSVGHASSSAGDNMPSSPTGSAKLGMARLTLCGRDPSCDKLGKLDDEELQEEMKEVFNLFDKEGRGAIDPKEVRVQMSKLGFQADNTTIYQLMSDLDTDGSQMLEIDEFEWMMHESLQYNSDDYLSRRHLKEIFEFLDNLDPAQRTGKLELEDLKRVANALGDSISDVELEAMVKAASSEGETSVSCEDFYLMMVGRADKASESGSLSSSEEERTPSASPQLTPTAKAGRQRPLLRKSTTLNIARRREAQKAASESRGSVDGDARWQGDGEGSDDEGHADASDRIERQAAIVARAKARYSSEEDP